MGSDIDRGRPPCKPLSRRIDPFLFILIYLFHVYFHTIIPFLIPRTRQVVIVVWNYREFSLSRVHLQRPHGASGRFLKVVFACVCYCFILPIFHIRKVSTVGVDFPLMITTWPIPFTNIRLQSSLSRVCAYCLCQPSSILG